MPVKGKGGNFRDRVTKKAREAGLPVEKVNVDEFTDGDQPNGQRPLVDGIESKIAVIVGDKMNCEYVRPHFSEDKDGRFLLMEFSMALTDEHKGMIPKSVEEVWKFMVKRHSESGQFRNIDDIPTHTVEIFLAADTKKILRLTGSEVSSATLAIVEEKGSGKEKKVYRFSFRLKCDPTQENRDFATLNYGNSLWISMAETQGKLINEED